MLQFHAVNWLPYVLGGLFADGSVYSDFFKLATAGLTVGVFV